MERLKLNVGRTILVGLAFFTITMFWQVYDSLMPLFLKDFKLSQTVIGVVMALDNILALALLPFMGLLSDRFPMKLRSRFGRRMPFIVCGSVLAAVTLLLVNFAHNERLLWLMLAAAAFMLVFMCLYRTPAVALMPDVTPKQIRSQGNTVINIMGTVGGVITLLLMQFLLKYREVEETVDGVMQTVKYIEGNNWIIIALIALLMVAASVVMIFKVKENKFVEEKMKTLERLGISEDEDADDPENADLKTKKKVFGSLSRSEKISLVLILSSVFLWYMAYNAVTTHFSVFSTRILGINFTTPLLVANAAAFIMFVPASIIGKKIGRKNTVLIGVGMLIVGFAFATVLIFTSGVEVVKIAMYPTFILVGGGWATINVHSFVMSVEMASKETTGVYTGLYYTFVSCAQIITPILAGAVMDYITPKGLLPYALLFAALAFLTMLFVRHGNVTKGDEGLVDMTGDIGEEPLAAADGTQETK